MAAQLHHSRARDLLLLLHAPAASPSLAPSASSGGNVPGDARPASDAERAIAVLNANAILALALLVCGLLAALALHVVLRCALRVTRRACYGGADDAPPREEHHRQIARHGRPRKKKQRVAALVQALPCLAYSPGLELAGSSRSECAICLAEFARGEPVRVLPRCGHGFHARCIDRWLAARPTCPTCRQPPFAERALLQLQPDADRARAAGQPAVVQLVRVVIVSDGVEP
ncbi:hypothetical protein ACP70R_034304 [Stipagrostis hirtigluma subsp. patula]